MLCSILDKKKILPFFLGDTLWDKTAVHEGTTNDGLDFRNLKLKYI